MRIRSIQGDEFLVDRDPYVAGAQRAARPAATPRVAPLPSSDAASSSVGVRMLTGGSQATVYVVQPTSEMATSAVQDLLSTAPCGVYLCCESVGGIRGAERHQQGLVQKAAQADHANMGPAVALVCLSGMSDAGDMAVLECATSLYELGVSVMLEVRAHLVPKVANAVQALVTAVDASTVLFAECGHATLGLGQRSGSAVSHVQCRLYLLGFGRSQPDLTLGFCERCTRGVTEARRPSGPIPREGPTTLELAAGCQRHLAAEWSRRGTFSPGCRAMLGMASAQPIDLARRGLQTAAFRKEHIATKHVPGMRNQPRIDAVFGHQRPSEVSRGNTSSATPGVLPRVTSPLPRGASPEPCAEQEPPPTSEVQFDTEPCAEQEPPPTSEVQFDPDPCAEQEPPPASEVEVDLRLTHQGIDQLLRFASCNAFWVGQPPVLVLQIERMMRVSPFGNWSAAMSDGVTLVRCELEGALREAAECEELTALDVVEVLAWDYKHIKSVVRPFVTDGRRVGRRVMVGFPVLAKWPP